MRVRRTRGHDTVRAKLTAPVPFVDLLRCQRPIEPELRAAYERVLARGDYVLGGELESFEREFADYIGVAECVGVASGTAALTLALSAAGIGAGDEVIVPAYTFIASALAVIHAGARPVLADVNEATGLIDLDSAAQVLSGASAAIMPVHLYGQVCDMDAVAAFASLHGLAVIEDAAQAHGARWGDRRAGSTGTASGFSFYPSKNLGALGDGGALCTNDPGIAGAARRLRNLGQADKGEHVALGHNERLDTLQAALLRVKLRHLDGWNEQRREAAAWYFEGLTGGVQTLPEESRSSSVFHVFAVRVSERERVATRLVEAGIGSRVHYSLALQHQPPLQGIVGAQALPQAEAWAREQLSLPMFSGITNEEVRRVTAVLGEAVAP